MGKHDQMRILKTDKLFETIDAIEEPFSVKGIATKLGFAASTVGMPVRHLMQEGLLKRTTVAYKKKLYEKTDEWNLVEAIFLTAERMKKKADDYDLLKERRRREAEQSG